MFRLIYLSVPKVPFLNEELLLLLQRARVHNLSKDVTGILLYSDVVFVQLLEGTHEGVSSAYERVIKDRRHRVVSILFEGEELESERFFLDWNMGFHHLARLDQSEIPGLMAQGTDVVLQTLSGRVEDSAAVLRSWFLANRTLVGS